MTLSFDSIALEKIIIIKFVYLSIVSLQTQLKKLKILNTCIYEHWKST